jgi:hypothetical protein
MEPPNYGEALWRVATPSISAGYAIARSIGWRIRVDYDLECDLENWRWLHPTAPSRSRAIRLLLEKDLAAAKKEREGLQFRG